MTKDKKDFGEKPVLEMGDLARNDNVPNLSGLNEKLLFQAEQIDKLWQVIKQQGLEVGVPELIVSDMAEVMSIIDKASSLWDNNKVIDSEILQDEYINKQRDNGDLINAESMRHSQVLRLRETRITIKNFIVSMQEALRRIQKRVQQ